MSEITIFELTADQIKEHNPKLHKAILEGAEDGIDVAVESEMPVEDLKAGQVKKWIPALYQEIREGTTKEQKEAVLDCFKKSEGGLQ